MIVLQEYVNLSRKSDCLMNFSVVVLIVEYSRLPLSKSCKDSGKSHS